MAHEVACTGRVSVAALSASNSTVPFLQLQTHATRMQSAKWLELAGERVTGFNHDRAPQTRLWLI